MKPLQKSLLMYALVAASLCGLSGCDDDDAPEPQLTGQRESYTLSSVTNSGVSGTATFAERDDGQILVTLELAGLQAGSMHPAHIHANAAAEGGSIVLSLEAVDGSTGKSETVVDALDNGTTISYETLIGFDGHVNVHMSPADLTVIASADIGENALTGDAEEYPLAELGGSGVSGTATFAKRKSGTAQITLALTGTTAGGDHPAHIHANDAATGGGIVIDLNNVDGATGKSVTSVDALNDGTAISYDELISFNGHINVHESATNLATKIAQGNIGSNAP